MSHEIRTPINAVMGMDEMILRRCDDEEVLSYALDIRKASNSLLSIINDILDVSKIESGKMEIFPVAYDLSGLIHDVYSSVAVRARDKGLELKLEVDECLPNMLNGDDIRIRQIITNLLSNGVKYTMNGSVTLSVSGNRTKEDQLLLAVRIVDTGIGIKEEDLPKLLEKFQRIEENRNRNIEGTGLGMNITVSLLEMMGGSLKVESEYGKGSCFSFEILQGIENPEPIGNLQSRFSEITHVKAQNEKMSWIAPKAKLLVVDDNAMNLKVFEQLLKQYMMRIDQVDSGEACLEKVAQVHYDMIFLDDMMPGMDGVQTLEIMKGLEENQCQDTPVIALTANAVKGAMEGYLQAGFDGYLAKPIVPERLENMILEHLGADLVEFGGWDRQLDELDEERGKSEDGLSAQNEAGENDSSNTVKTPEFPEISGIDWKYGMSVWCDPELLMDLALDFYHELETVIHKLGTWEAQIEEEEAVSLFCIRVHSLKGAAATIGAMELSAMAKILEKAAKARNAEMIHQLWPHLKGMLEEYQENMSILEKEN